MQIGTLSVFMTYATGLMEPVQWLARVISDLIAVQVNIERVTHLLATESDVKDSPEVIEKYGDCFHPKKENWEPLAGRVTFDDVTFRYPDGDVNVLEHFKPGSAGRLQRGYRGRDGRGQVHHCQSGLPLL